MNTDKTLFAQFMSVFNGIGADALTPGEYIADNKPDDPECQCISEGGGRW